MHMCTQTISHRTISSALTFPHTCIYIYLLTRVHQELDLHVLTTEKENDKLFTVLCNYLSLSQFELARTVIDDLFKTSPERVTHVLRSLVLAPIPSSWLFSKSVPSAGHLAWLAYIEYRQLYRRWRGDDATASPWKSVPLDLAFSPPLQMNVPSSSSAPSNNNMNIHHGHGSSNARANGGSAYSTPINPHGFLSHDQLNVEVVAGKDLMPYRHVTQYSLRLVYEKKAVQTQPATITGKKSVSWRETFPCKITYGDSKLVLQLLALVPTNDLHQHDSREGRAKNNNRSANGSSQDAFQRHKGSENRSTASSHVMGSIGHLQEIVVSDSVIPLHQLRQKDKYHIWVPLQHNADMPGSSPQVRAIPAHADSAPTGR